MLSKLPLFLQLLHFVFIVYIVYDSIEIIIPVISSAHSEKVNSSLINLRGTEKRFFFISVSYR